MVVRYVLACAVLIPFTGVSQGQSSETWLMQNYRFTGPPPAGSIAPTDPVVSQLQEIQNTTLAILRKANFAGDFEAALAAAAQAAANARLIGAIQQRLQSSTELHKTAGQADSKAPVYLIALKDSSIQAATSCWTDAHMLHFIGLQGAHEQVRLDLVDFKFSSQLNGERNLPIP